jgi:hypothetical protein
LQLWKIGERTVYRLLVQKPEGRLGRPRHGGGDKSKMDLEEIGLGGVDCIALAWDRNKWRGLVNAVMNLGVP